MKSTHLALSLFTIFVIALAGCGGSGPAPIDSGSPSSAYPDAETIYLTGTVLDDQGNPIDGAVVSHRVGIPPPAPPLHCEGQAITDANGGFSLEISWVYAASFFIKVSKAGAGYSQITVNPQDAASLNITIIFNPQGGHTSSVSVASARSVGIFFGYDPQDEHISSISIAPKEAVVQAGAALQFTAVTDPPDGGVVWVVEGTGPETPWVDKNGLFHAYSPGQYTVTARSGIRWSKASVTVVDLISGIPPPPPPPPLGNWSKTSPASPI